MALVGGNTKNVYLLMIAQFMNGFGAYSLISLGYTILADFFSDHLRHIGIVVINAIAYKIYLNKWMCSVYDWGVIFDETAVAVFCAVFSVYTVVGIDCGVLLLFVLVAVRVDES